MSDRHRQEIVTDIAPEKVFQISIVAILAILLGTDFKIAVVGESRYVF